MKAHTNAIVARFRPAYFEEVRRLAEDLRPGFEAGELCDYSDDEDTGGRDRLEALCAERFGLVVTENKQAGEFEGDEEAAKLICTVSPSTERWDPEEDWYHLGYCATACVAQDVLMVAQERGWLS